MTTNNKIIDQLKQGITPFTKIHEFSSNPGIYAIGFIGEVFPFPTGENVVNNGDIIYIGKTEKSQKSRDAQTHFKSGKTGSSTLRRSLGAILREDLGLQPIPRSKTESRMRDYKFIEESEKQLTQWMMKNLSISFFEICEGKRLIRNAEIYIIQELEPILNLTHNSSNPYMSMLKELREKCKMIAKNKDDK